MRRNNTLQFPQITPESEDDAPSNYRGTVVELPWPDFLGRRILLAIDWNGHVFDQTAVIEHDVQRVTDRMTDDLDLVRERQQGPRLLSGGVSLPVFEMPESPGA